MGQHWNPFGPVEEHTIIMCMWEHISCTWCYIMSLRYMSMAHFQFSRPPQSYTYQPSYDSFELIVLPWRHSSDLILRWFGVMEQQFIPIVVVTHMLDTVAVKICTHHDVVLCWVIIVTAHAKRGCQANDLRKTGIWLVPSPLQQMPGKGREICY